jgi:predicted ATPase with chaperone activity
MLTMVRTCALQGLDGVIVEVEVDIAPGLPAFTVVGLPDAAVQAERFKGTGIASNADMGPAQVWRYCVMDEAATGLAKAAMERLHLSARSFHRTLKLARTVADLAGAQTIGMAHLAEAVQYRHRAAD